MSLFDDDLIENDNILIIQYIQKNYTTFGFPPTEFYMELDVTDFITIHPDRTVDANCDVFLKCKSDATTLTDGLFRWGDVSGRFVIGGHKLTSTIGCPKKCKSFEINLNAENLRHVEELPEEMETFNAYESKIWTITDSPRKMNNVNLAHTNIYNIDKLFANMRESNIMDLDITDCIHLRDLPTLPKEMRRLYLSGCSGLRNLKHIIDRIDNIDRLYVDTYTEMLTNLQTNRYPIISDQLLEQDFTLMTVADGVYVGYGRKKRVLANLFKPHETLGELGGRYVWECEDFKVKRIYFL